MNHIAWTKRKAAIALSLCVIIAVSSVMFLQNNQTTQAALVNPHPGLVGWWRFDELSGTVASDSSGNGYNGNVVGASWWTIGKYNGALSFSGSVSNYVSIPSVNIASGPFTLQAWVKPNLQSSYMTIMGIDGTHRLLISPSGTLLTQFGGNFFSTGTVPTNTWSLVTYVYDGTHELWYINGVLDGQHTPTSTPTWASTFYVGQYDLANYAYNGLIDEVQTYNRALSLTEIQANFQQSPDLSPYLLANIPQGATQVITTLSWQGNGNITVLITTPTQTYTENQMVAYQKTTYSTTSNGPMTMLNIKRLSINFGALVSTQTWNITLTYDNTVSAYQISVETQA
jgi:hypothetical protein